MKMLIWIICLLGAVSPASAMTVDQVIDLSREGASAKTIIRQIHAKRVVFKLEPEDEEKLRTAGVDIVVVEWMRNSQFVYGDPQQMAQQSAGSGAFSRARIVDARARKAHLDDLRGRELSGGIVLGVGTIATAVGAFALGLQYLNSDEYPQNYLPMTVTTAVGGAIMVTGILVQPSEREILDAERRLKYAKRAHRFAQPRAWSVPVAAFRF